MLEHDGDDGLRVVARADHGFEVDRVLLVHFREEDVEGDGVAVTGTGAQDHENIPEPPFDALAELCIVLGRFEPRADRRGERDGDLETCFVRERRDVDEHAIFDGLFPAIGGDDFGVTKQAG